ncbi:hypothetical protein RIF29_17439 [Crotalaria pallida]|uniref:Dirigent protein n=1 Tax=Crotalaria pallida TaxID=3830 RepID=A0AAN9FMX9_CROPI
MMKISTLSVLSLLLFTCVTIQVHSEYYSKQTSNGFHLKEKVTHLHFYFFDILGGNKPTAVEVARPNTTIGSKSSISPFGHVYAIDDILREGPDANSKVVGNAQGLYLSSSLDKVASLVVYIDYEFTTGKFKGSSISLFSRNPVSEKTTNRELAVVGGRGKFRMARGFAECRTHYLNFTSGDAIVEYNVTVVHY